MAKPRVLSWCWLAVAALIVSAGAGCATGGRVTRPSPFPTAAPLPLPVTRRAAAPAALPPASSLLHAATDLRGIAYRLGGDSPADGFDCSGFVRYVFSLFAVDLPRTVAEQYAVGAVVDPARIQPGDLVFFTTVAPGASHVGLALDATTFIHAPGSGSSVRIDRLDAPYWRERLIGVRRPLDE